MAVLLLVAFVLPLFVFVGTIAGAKIPTDLTGFPPCAQTCISNNHGTCALLDMDCMCDSQVPSIFRCMQGSCNAEDQATTLQFAQDLCDQANVTSTSKLPGVAGAGATTLSTATVAATRPANAISSPSPSTSASPSSSSAAEPPKSGMSTGAMAGAGVGAVLGVMAVAAGGVFLWRRRTRSRGVEELSGSGVREVKQNALMPPEYGKGVEDTHIIHHEVDGVQWMELEAKETTR